MADNLNRTTKGILGDIDPIPSAREHMGGDAFPDEAAHEHQEGAEESAGSRDVTGGTTGGAEVGGTRNYRTGTGASGSDIGNRPE
jgi:hypothetical protein